MSKLGRKYPVVKDPIDLRDKVYRSTTHAKLEALPNEVDLSLKMSPIVDQGQLGSCTANAMASGLREYLLLQAGMPLTRLSRLYLYYHERALEGTVSEDAGAIIRDGMKVLQQLGVATEGTEPYDISKFTQAPSAQAEAEAGQYKITEYHRVADTNGVMASLAEGLPVVIGMKVYASFESADVARSGKVPMPKRGEQLLGGHAVLVVGYKKVGRTVTYKVRNSWGTGWGDNGYFYMSSSVFKRLVMDMWTGK